MSSQYVYSGGFIGFLTCVFDSYERKVTPLTIIAEERYTPQLLDTPVQLEPDQVKAGRVQKGLLKYINKSELRAIYKVYLSEQEGVELLLYHYIKKTLAAKESIQDSYADDEVMAFHKILKKVNREEHRMHAFVRFQHTKDNIYMATIEPDFNILPLLSGFFQRRFADQQWLIYDTKRKFGIYYNLHEVVPVELEALNIAGKIDPNALHEEERAFQQLWKDYFEATNIKERKNPKLHVQHVPKRYWKYLPEKYL